MVCSSQRVLRKVISRTKSLLGQTLVHEWEIASSLFYPHHGTDGRSGKGWKHDGWKGGVAKEAARERSLSSERAPDVSKTPRLVKKGDFQRFHWTGIFSVVCKHPFRGDTTMVSHRGRPFCKGWVLQTEHGNKELTVLPSIGIQDDLMESLSNEMLHLQNRIDNDTDGSSGSLLGHQMIWKKGDFAINDNLGLVHYASSSTQISTKHVGLTILHRTTIIGDDSTIPRKENGLRLTLQ